MVAFNMLWKLCVVVALGLSATVSSTDVAQDQPKKESFISRFFGKNEKSATKPVEVKEPTNTDSQENTDAEEPPRFYLEWLLLPTPKSRAALRSFLPLYMSFSVPKDCNEPIGPSLEKRIKKYLSLYGAEWYLLPEPESRTALRNSIPSELAAMVPEDYRRPMFSAVEDYIRTFFSLCAAKWYMLPEPESRTALRYVLPKDLADKVPEDYNEPIKPEVENDIKEYFSFSLEKQKLRRLGPTLMYWP